MIGFGVKMMTNDYTPFEVFHDPSIYRKAQTASKFAAIDILYACPTCGSERVFTWLFPDQEASYVDECCGANVRFQVMEVKV